MKRLSIEEAKQIELDILAYIDSFCKKHDIAYFINYGTLIGAIRHKGFIPWDDDIDIVMPRPDHDKLIQIIKNMNSPDFGIMDSYDLDSFYTTRILKVYSKKTCLKEFPHKYHLEYGAFVDVFAVNGMPNDIRTIKKMQQSVFICSRVLHMYISSIYRIKGNRKKFKMAIQTIRPNSLAQD